MSRVKELTPAVEAAVEVMRIRSTPLDIPKILVDVALGSLLHLKQDLKQMVPTTQELRQRRQNRIGLPPLAITRTLIAIIMEIDIALVMRALPVRLCK